jgi:hypothetical protein
VTLTENLSQIDYLAMLASLPYEQIALAERAKTEQIAFKLFIRLLLAARRMQRPLSS